MPSPSTSDITNVKDAHVAGDESSSNMANIAFENQVGRTNLKPAGTGLVGDTLDIPALSLGTTKMDVTTFTPSAGETTGAEQPRLSASTALVAENPGMAKVQTNATEGTSVSKPDTKKPAADSGDPRSVHPFTWMDKDGHSLTSSTTALNKDSGTTPANEKNSGVELHDLKDELDEVSKRHPANNPQYKQEVDAGETAISKLRSDLTALERGTSASKLNTFNTDEKSTQHDLQDLYQWALDNKSSGGGSGPGGDGNKGGDGGSKGSQSATDGLVLDVTGETSLKQAISSGMDFTSVRLWDNGCKPSQLINANGTDNQNAWDTLTKLVDTAHSADKSVIYTFGEPRGDDGAMPSDATVKQWADQISKWSATQKVEGKGGIDTYELWNEPSYDGYWKGTPAQFAQITDIMDETIRKNDPTAKIAAPAVSFWGDNPVGFETQYFQDVEKDMGVKSLSKVFDQVDFHDYTTQSTGSIVTDIDAMKGVMAKFGLSGEPLVETEAGLYDPSTNSQQNANLLAQSYLLSAGNGAEDAVYSYGDKKFGGLPGPGQSQTELNTVEGWLVGATVEKQSDQDGIYSMTIEKNGKQETIAWATSDTTDTYTPGKPYSRYENADGQWQSITGSFGLTDGPVLIAGS